MRSELSEEPTNSMVHQQNQFVEDISQSVANVLFGYSSVNETPSAVSAEEESSARRPKRSTKKVQQVRRSILEYKSFILYKFLSYSEMVQCICIMALPFVSSFNGKKFVCVRINVLVGAVL